MKGVVIRLAECDICHVLHTYLDISKDKLVRSELIQTKSSDLC